MSNRKAVICDLDGTLASYEHHRGPYDEMKAGKDRVVEPVASVIKALDKDGFQIVYVSGRQDKAYEVTMSWLQSNNLPDGPLFMRPTNDRRKDFEIKKEIYLTKVAPNYDVQFVIDDRLQVLKQWYSLGIFTFNVNQTNEDF